jgi:molybdate transport system substrate-binding protein
MHLNWLVGSLVVALAVSPASSASASSLRIAVAANFKPALEELVAVFRLKHPVDVDVSSGATGALYAQITMGAPYDIFLAADIERPLRLEQEGAIVPLSRRTYALGRLAFWMPGEEAVSESSLSNADFPLATASPKLAPYGRAASEVMKYMGLETNKIIQANNVAQAYLFIETGNVEGGFVALSQLVHADIKAGQSGYWLVPETYHKPIEQQLVMLNSKSGTSGKFIDFLGSEEARKMIRSFGYDLPDPPLVATSTRKSD